MRAVFPAEMYKEDLYRVVWGQEEEARFARLGWTEEMPVGKDRADYKVHHHEAAKSNESGGAHEPEPEKRGPGRPPSKPVTPPLAT